MAMSQASAEALERYREQLRAAEREPVERITNAWADSSKRILDEVDALLAEIAAKGITRGTEVGRLPQHRQLMRLIDDELRDLSVRAARSIERAQRSAIQAAIEGGRAFAAGQARSQAQAERVTRQLRPISQPAIDGYAGMLPDGTTFQDAIERLGAGIGQAIAKEIVAGVKRGAAAQEIVEESGQRVERGFRRALSITRNGVYDGSRWAMNELLAENAGQLAGGQRLESMDEITCVVCMALHGKKYPPGRPFERHPGCRGLLVPLLAGGDDLEVESGEAMLRRQPESVQLAAFDGDKTAHAAWASGELALSDFVEVHDEPGGPWTGKLSLKDARAKVSKAVQVGSSSSQGTTTGSVTRSGLQSSLGLGSASQLAEAIKNMASSDFIVISTGDPGQLSNWPKRNTDEIGVPWSLYHKHLVIDHPDRLQIPQFVEKMIETVNSPGEIHLSASDPEKANFIAEFDNDHDMVVSLLIPSDGIRKNAVLSARTQKKARTLASRKQNVVVWKK